MLEDHLSNLMHVYGIPVAGVKKVEGRLATGNYNR